MLILGNEVQVELLKGGSHCSTSYLLVHLKHEQLSIDGLSLFQAAYCHYTDSSTEKHPQKSQGSSQLTSSGNKIQ